jgi:hypothetical protein
MWLHHTWATGSSPRSLLGSLTLNAGSVPMGAPAALPPCRVTITLTFASLKTSGLGNKPEEGTCWSETPQWCH